MREMKLADIIAPNHRAVAKAYIYKELQEQIITTIPQLHEKSIFFTAGEELSLVCSNHETIDFYRVKYNRIETDNGKVYFVFDVLEANNIINSRKEERMNVEIQSLVSDYFRVYIATILDISISGLRVETNYELKTHQIEIYYDQRTKTNSKKANVIWHKIDQKTNKHYYGLLVNDF